MIKIDIPGDKVYQLAHLVLDYNGTLACDGRLLPGVTERLTELAEHLAVHVLTADTFGSAQAALVGIPCRVEILPAGDQAEENRRWCMTLGLQ